MHRWPKRSAMAGVCVAWMAFWFWVFSYSFSSSFFLYNRHSRLPIFAAAWFGSCAILGSAYLQWRRRRPVIVACLQHLVGVTLALSPLLIVSAISRRASHPWRPSADDAMGTGIDFLILCGLGIVSEAVLAIALLARAARDRRGRRALG